MAYDSIQAVILAAGTSNRFHTSSSKLLAKICGQEMILYTTKLLSSMNIPTTLVTGFQGDLLQSVVQKHHLNISFIRQEEQKGTGHALAQTKDSWRGDHILVLNGDMPFITQEIIQELITHHREKNATITFATAHYTNPPLSNYGRVIKHGDVLKIVEAQDCSTQINESCCINAGAYVIKKNFLQNYLHTLSNNNAAHEYYITDLIGIATKNNYPVQTLSVPFDHIRGINDLKELWTADQIKRSELISHFMNNGVRFLLAQSTHLDNDVTIGSGTSIGAGVHLINGTTIGTHCTIEPFSILNNAHIANNVTISSHCVIENATIEKDCAPFTHIYNNVEIIHNEHLKSKIHHEVHHETKTTSLHDISFIGATKTHCDTPSSEK